MKRFMADGDVFVHADIHGASCVVVKIEAVVVDSTTFYPRVPPITTLKEAAQLSIVHSRSWESKQIPAAYYVYKE